MPTVTSWPTRTGMGVRSVNCCVFGASAREITPVPQSLCAWHALQVDLIAASTVTVSPLTATTVAVSLIIITQLRGYSLTLLTGRKDVAIALAVCKGISPTTVTWALPSVNVKNVLTSLRSASVSPNASSAG